MTPIDEVFMLEISTKLDPATLREVYSRGYSRIPVYDRRRDNIIGILMSRDLILVNPDKALLTLKQLSSIIMRDIVAVDDHDKIEPILNYFKKGLTHFGVVCKIVEQTGLDPVKKVVGIVTMEDIIEELLGDEIQDEYEAQEERNQRKILKEKLALYYTDNRAGKMIDDSELKACLQFLETYCHPFRPQYMKRDVLHVLIRRSLVLSIKGDEFPFSHNLTQMDELGQPKGLQARGVGQDFYNRSKKVGKSSGLFERKGGDEQLAPIQEDDGEGASTEKQP